MTKTFTLHRSNGVRVSPCFQNDGVEGEEEKGLSQELPTGANDKETRPTIGAALPGWLATRDDDGACSREKEREARRRRRLGEKEGFELGARGRSR